MTALVLATCTLGTPPPAPSLSPSAIVSDPCHEDGITYCALNPNVSQSTIHSTICVVGWTATIRPPVSYTASLKIQQMATEGLPGSTAAYEEDHRMPLELGGAPRDPMNLSPEAHPASFTKDAAENQAKAQVCAGGALRQIQGAFIQTWLASYPGYKTP